MQNSDTERGATIEMSTGDLLEGREREGTPLAAGHTGIPRGRVHWRWHSCTLTMLFIFRVTALVSAVLVFCDFLPPACAAVPLLALPTAVLLIPQLNSRLVIMLCTDFKTIYILGNVLVFVEHLSSRSTLESCRR